MLVIYHYNWVIFITHQKKKKKKGKIILVAKNSTNKSEAPYDFKHHGYPPSSQGDPTLATSNPVVPSRTREATYEKKIHLKWYAFSYLNT